MVLKSKNDIERTYEAIPVAGTQELVKDLPAWTTRWGILAVALFIVTVVPVLFLVPVDVVHKVDCNVRMTGVERQPLLIVQLNQAQYAKIRRGQKYQASLMSFPDQRFEVTVVQIGNFSTSKSTFEAICAFQESAIATLNSPLEEGMTGSFVLERYHLSILESILRGF